jgi:cytochrome c oxidase subunit I+III
MTSRRPLSERLGKWVFWLMFVGMQRHLPADAPDRLMGMPRRVYTYLPTWDWEVPQLHLDRRRVHPWRRRAAVPRRPRPQLPLHGRGRRRQRLWRRHARMAADRALLDPQHSRWCGAAAAVGRSRHLRRRRKGPVSAPQRAPTGHRETIITSPIRAEPQYLQIMPGPSFGRCFPPSSPRASSSC